MFSLKKQNIDWLLVACSILIVGAGILTMSSFVGNDIYFMRQVIWFLISFTVFLGLSLIDFRFLKQSNFLIILYACSLIFLGLIFVLGMDAKGATRWLSIGSVSIQVSDFVKLILIIILAKYFSRRHVEIKNIKHLFISGIYMVLPVGLVFLQPDFGTALILFFIWFVMTLVSGISKKHLAIVFGAGLVLATVLWTSVLQDYQKNRITSFLNPLSDIQGTGYNAYQSTIAVGSGQILGKGVGYGTQSRLKFLPEYHTDFIFAAFAEEWGFVGVMILFILYCVIIWRILRAARYGATNFEMLYAVGLAILFSAHIIVNIGMNIGYLPVTGLTLPFMSYGGSHMLMSFIGLGILMGLRRNERSVHRDDISKEFLGL